MEITTTHYHERMYDGSAYKGKLENDHTIESFILSIPQNYHLIVGIIFLFIIMIIPSFRIDLGKRSQDYEDGYTH